MNILITGGTSGLGEESVKKLSLNPDHHVYFTYIKSLVKSNEICSAFPNTTAVHCDFSDQNSVSSLIAQLSHFNIDVLINNAYTQLHKEHFHKSDAGVFLNSFRENIFPVLQITQESIKIFRKKKFGKIINIISSVVVNTPPIGWSEYTANKAYLVSMSKSWATENIRFNITSNCISPAFMQTPFTSDTDERMVEEIINNHPLKKLLTPSEVADAIVYLTGCSQQINGINLIINSGTSIT